MIALVISTPNYSCSLLSTNTQGHQKAQGNSIHSVYMFRMPPDPALCTGFFSSKWAQCLESPGLAGTLTDLRPSNYLCLENFNISSSLLITPRKSLSFKNTCIA